MMKNLCFLLVFLFPGTSSAPPAELDHTPQGREDNENPSLTLSGKNKVSILRLDLSYVGKIKVAPLPHEKGSNSMV